MATVRMDGGGKSLGWLRVSDVLRFEMPIRPHRYGGRQADVKGPGAAAVPETTRGQQTPGGVRCICNLGTKNAFTPMLGKVF